MKDWRADPDYLDGLPHRVDSPPPYKGSLMIPILDSDSPVGNRALGVICVDFHHTQLGDRDLAIAELLSTLAEDALRFNRGIVS